MNRKSKKPTQMSENEKYNKQMAEQAAYTKRFWTRQSFGAASPVRRISVEDYMKEKQDGN